MTRLEGGSVGNLTGTKARNDKQCGEWQKVAGVARAQPVGKKSPGDFEPTQAFPHGQRDGR